jgi:tripartite-type tricarboxylate transporter receptor subunit TctC
MHIIPMFKSVLISLSLLGMASAGAQTKFPSKPITIIVPFAPGGNLDVITRLIGPVMGRDLGQSIIIENKAGAGGLVGLQHVAKATPDGYTLAITANGSFAITPKLQIKPPITSADFIPVGSVAVTPMVIEVNASGKFKDFKEFLDQAKAHPGKLSIGHAGNGTTNHAAILQLEQTANVKFNIIPYKGSGPAITDLLAGQIDAVIDQLPSSFPHINSGKFRPLALTTSNRSSDLPNVPTISELGLKGFNASTTAGLVMPARTPDNIVLILNKALNAALSDPEVKSRLKALGSDVKPSSPAEFKAFLDQEETLTESLIKSGLLQQSQ